MFRKPSHVHTDPFDLEKIHQHVAAIKFLSEALVLSSKRHHINSFMAVLNEAINKFEKHRFDDYVMNETKRAEQVLHTRNIFQELYKHKLKKSDSSIIAHALKHELKDYAATVKCHIHAIQDDLTAGLQEQFEANLQQQESDLLDKELDLLGQEITSYQLIDKIESIEAEEEFEFRDVTDESEDIDYGDKPFLRGSFSSIESDSDNYVSEDDLSAAEPDSDFEPSFAEEGSQSSDENSFENSPVTPRYSRF